MGVRLAFAPDGKSLAVAALRSRDLVFRDVATGQKLAELETDGWIDAFAFAPDAKSIAITHTVSSNGDTVSLWDCATRKLQATFPKEGRHRTVPTAVTFSPDGKTVGEVSENTVRLWDFSTKKQIHKSVHEAWPKIVAFTKKGDPLMFCERWIWQIAPC